MNPRSEALATRLEGGAQALAEFASTLSEAEWNTPLPKDGRKIGVVIHHVATMYPLEIQLAGVLASGEPITGLVWDAVHQLNAKHAEENATMSKQDTLALLAANSQAAASYIRALINEELDRAAPVSLYGDAPLSCQFFIEDHALRHSYHHLAHIRTALAR